MSEPLVKGDIYWVRFKPGTDNAQRITSWQLQAWSGNGFVDLNVEDGYYGTDLKHVDEIGPKVEPPPLPAIIEGKSI